MFPDKLLRAIRNDLPMRVNILQLGPHGPPSKQSDGFFHFLCPVRGEMRP